MTAITDKERLDFVEKNPRSIGLAPKWTGKSDSGYQFDWIDIREMIDSAMAEAVKPKTVVETFIKLSEKTPDFSRGMIANNQI